MMWIFSKLDKNDFEISVDQISHMLIALNNNTYMFS